MIFCTWRNLEQKITSIIFNKSRISNFNIWLLSYQKMYSMENKLLEEMISFQLFMWWFTWSKGSYLGKKTGNSLSTSKDNKSSKITWKMTWILCLESTLMIIHRFMPKFKEWKKYNKVFLQKNFVNNFLDKWWKFLTLHMISILVSNLNTWGMLLYWRRFYSN